MKKILLSAVAIIATMSVNAQEIAVINADAIGISSDAVEIAGGTEIMKTESVKCSVLFTDNYKATGLSENNVTVNDADFGSTTGIQGSTNPPASATEGTYPEQGCIYSFNVSKDGFLYVIHKASANKNYVVWENKLRVPYIYAAADGGAFDLNAVEGATVTADGITTIADSYVIPKAQEIIGTEGLGAGTCVIKVQVFKDCQYDIHATGSKMTMAGFIFDEKGDATIKAGDVTLLNKGQIAGAPASSAAEIAVIDADAIGIGSDAVEIAGGTEIMKTESVKCSVLFTDNYKATGLSENNVTVNDADFGSTTGIQGSTNPPASATEGTYPEQGCIYSFNVSKDGFLYVIHKASANKNYVVWENKLRVPYIYAAADGGAFDLNAVEGATVTADGITTIADSYVIPKAQEIIGTEGLGAGTCVIKVQVFKDCQYDIHATGSKMTMAGFIFDEKGDATIKAGDVTLLNKGQIAGAPSSIQGVKAATNNDAAIYNLAGQKVNVSYKGVVIQNGKKFLQK